MSAFSRGILLRQRMPSTSARLSSPSSSFTTTSIFRAASKARAPLPKTSTLPKASPQIYTSYATTLAQKTSPTLLYNAPSHTLFLIASYTGASFCFAYAAYNFEAHYVNPPADLARWIPMTFGVICFGMAAFGGWLVLGPARIVKSITAIPPSATSRHKNLVLNIELRKMFPVPFFPARVVTAFPEEVALGTKLWTPPNAGKLSAREKLEMQLKERERLRKELEYERSHIMTAPFRHANKAFYELFKAIARTWSREGFMKMDVKGQKYKLDVSGGWALDDGKALDRLVKIKLI